MPGLLPSAYVRGADTEAESAERAGNVSKVFALLAAFGVPGAQIHAFTFGVYARSRQKNAAKIAARDATAVVLKAVQPTESNTSAFIVYGVTAVQGARVFMAVNKGDRVPIMPSGLPSVGRIPFDSEQADSTTRRIECNPNEFYLAQYVKSVGDTGPIFDMAVDGKRTDLNWDDEGLKGPYGGTLAAAWEPNYGTASVFASEFVPARRGATAKFNDLSYLDFVAQMPDSNKGKYRIYRGRTPDPVFFTEGRRGEYFRLMVGGAPTATVHKSDNAGAVLLDYLTCPLYGPSLGDASIDMADLQTFYDQCERSLQDDTAAPGSQGDETDCNDLKSTANESELAQLEAAEQQLATARLSGNTESIASALAAVAAACKRIRDARGYASRATVPGETKSYKQHLGKVRWGAYNGVVDTALYFPDAVEQIIQGIPGCVVAGTFGDKLRITAPDWRQTSAQQSVATITDAEFTEPPQLSDPDIEQRVNRHQVTYNSIDDSWHENTETWIDDDLYAADNNEELESEERVSGVCTNIQALTLSRHRTLISRRGTLVGTYNILKLGQAMGKSVAVLEPNDVFRAQSVEGDIDGYFIVQEMSVDMSAATCQFTAIEFNPLDYGPVLAARHTEFESTEEALSTGAFVRVAGVPANPIPGGTTLAINASVEGTAETATFTFEGTGVANTAGGSTDWTPTAADNTLTVKATIGTCELTAVATVTVADAGSPTVEIVAKGNDEYAAIANGFAASGTGAWEIAPSALGRLSSDSGLAVTLSGGSPNVRGEIRVRYTAGTETADDIVLAPFHPHIDDHGGANVVDGPERVI